MRALPKLREIWRMRASILAALERTRLPVTWTRSITAAVERGLFEVSPDRCVARGMRDPRAQHLLRDLREAGPNRLVALSLGKAAHGMHEALLRELPRPPDAHRFTTLHATLASRRSEAILTEHPDPGLGSLEAGAWARARCGGARAGDLLVACVSGGASSMMCGWESSRHDELRSLITRLRARGATIEEINAVRCAFDPLKRGGLRRHFQPGNTLTFVLSDTPFAPPSVVGSGPTIPSNPAPIRELLARYELSPPRHHRDRIEGAHAPINAPLDPAHVVIEVGDNDAAVAAIHRALHDDAHAVARGPSLRGDAFEAGRDFARGLGDGPPGLLVSGGECTTTIRGEGRGGRTMEFALGAAEQLRGRLDAGVVALATDGVDGTSGAGGAVGHGLTVEQLGHRGLTIHELLARSDSAAGLRAVGGLIESEPTGTNVADVAIGWRLPPRLPSP